MTRITVGPFASPKEIDAAIGQIVSELAADGEHATPEAILQLRQLILAASRPAMMPLHPFIAEEITRLREMDYGVELLRHDASTALIRMIGAEESIVCLIDIAQLNRGDETQH